MPRASAPVGAALPLGQSLKCEPSPCIGNDPHCPCQDGDACHYRDLPGSPAWPTPLCLPRITHPPGPVEMAGDRKFMGRAERDLQARIRALRPYVAALPVGGATAVEVAAALWQRTDARSCSQVASVLSVARRHGFVHRTYTKGTIAVFERTAAGDVLIAEPTP